MDVIISNCVINLSADKDRVLKEAFRVLKPGGRFAVSDVVTTGEMPAGDSREGSLVGGLHCRGLEENDYVAKLTAAGFTDVEIEPTRIYRMEDARTFLSGRESTSMRWRLKWMASSSAPSFGNKAGKQSCCAPGCCN